MATKAIADGEAVLFFCALIPYMVGRRVIFVVRTLKIASSPVFFCTLRYGAGSVFVVWRF